MGTNWHKRFLNLAALVAAWSKDESTQVGAVIVNSTQRIITTGFNGFPRGCNDAPLPRERKLLRTIHAEANAILHARCDVTGMTLYCTHYPCAACAALIVQSGIKRVVVPQQDYKFLARWREQVIEATTLFAEGSVVVIEESVGG